VSALAQATALIAESIGDDEISYADYNHDLHLELAELCDDYAENGNVVEYWGTCDDSLENAPWRVHLEKAKGGAS